MGLQRAGVPAHLYPAKFHPNGPLSLDSVTFAIVWKPPEGLLERCPLLRGVHSLGAGAWDACMAAVAGRNMLGANVQKS